MERSVGGVEQGEPMGVRATLRSGGLETHYRNAGTGHPVLLLGDAATMSAAARQLFERLSHRFRVIRPDPPRCADAGTGGGEATSIAAWLRGVIDGLGLDRCAILAESPMSLPAMWFAFTDPHRVTRLVLLVPEGPDPALPVQVALRTMERTAQSIMLIRLDPTCGALLPEGTLWRLVTFLQRLW